MPSGDEPTCVSTGLSGRPIGSIVAAELWLDLDMGETVVIEEVNVDLDPIPSDWESDDEAIDSGAGDVTDVPRVVCLVTALSLVVEKLLDEGMTRAAEAVEIVDLASVEGEEGKELLPIIAVFGLDGCNGLDAVWSSSS